MQLIKFDTEKFKFSKRLKEILLNNEVELNHIHNVLKVNEVFKRENDQSTNYHKKFYEFARTEEFEKMYSQFIKEVIKPIYDGKEIVYQKIPTFRIHLPGNIAVGEFHKDKAYRNLDWADKVKEDNYYFPMTDVFGTNTIWVESEEDKGDYSPMECKYGELYKWDGSNLMHGNKLNDTGFTRVSVDFRVMLKENYIPSDHGSINTKTQFAIGGYYEVC